MKHDLHAFSDFASIEAEHALIGGLLLNNRLFDLVGDGLKPEHFTNDTNRAVYAELARQLSAGKACDIVTVAAAMGDRVSIAELHSLAQYVPTTANAHRYAEILVDRQKSRALMAVAGEINDLAQDATQPIDSRVEQAQGLLAKLIDDAPRDDWVGAYEGMLEHSDLLERRQGGQLTAWPTGLSMLDEHLEGGLRPGELVIVGARPSMGKTALGLTIGVHMAHERPVGFVSMEMSQSEVRDRLTAMLGNVTMSSVKRPRKDDGLAWDRVVEGMEKAKHLQLRICDQGGLNINQVRAKARNAKRVGGLDVLVIDYIGLMSGLDPKANRNAQLGEVSRGLKTLAKELQISVLCLAQLNRAAEERPDSMPQMRDLRDSGEIEQDADVILFIKRPIMAEPDLGADWQRYAKLSVAKNRQGRCGYVDLQYVGEQTTFMSWVGPTPQRPAKHFSRGMS
jgi:replicative DNA helicase